MCLPPFFSDVIENRPKQSGQLPFYFPTLQEQHEGGKAHNGEPLDPREQHYQNVVCPLDVVDDLVFNVRHG